MGKAHALLEEISESADTERPAQAALMAAYDELLAGRDPDPGRGQPGRGVTLYRGPDQGPTASTRPRWCAAVVTPANRSARPSGPVCWRCSTARSSSTRHRCRCTRSCWTAGTYLCSVATMYRILAANAQVKERRRLARHPARVRPELVATGPGQVLHLGHHQARRPGQGLLLRRVRDDRHLLALHRRGPRARPRVRAAGRRR